MRHGTHQSLVEDKDLVVVNDGVKAVSDGQDGAVGELLAHRLLDQGVCLHIHVGGRFVQHLHEGGQAKDELQLPCLEHTPLVARLPLEPLQMQMLAIASSSTCTRVSTQNMSKPVNRTNNPVPQLPLGFCQAPKLHTQRLWTTRLTAGVLQVCVDHAMPSLFEPGGCASAGDWQNEQACSPEKGWLACESHDHHSHIPPSYSRSDHTYWAECQDTRAILMPCSNAESQRGSQRHLLPCTQHMRCHHKVVCTPHQSVACAADIAPPLM